MENIVTFKKILFDVEMGFHKSVVVYFENLSCKKSFVKKYIQPPKNSKNIIYLFCYDTTFNKHMLIVKAPKPYKCIAYDAHYMYDKDNDCLTKC